MTPDDLLREYEAALATQDWTQVEPLLHPEVCVTFSTGVSHRGRAEVQKAFSENFSVIQDEHYEISDIHWIDKDPCHATCTYEFRWAGTIDGKAASGAGRGTSVLKNEAGRWFLIAEHLGPLADR
jgi:ketosteroid isomerase-like protein